MINWFLTLIIMCFNLLSLGQKKDKHNHTLGYHHIFYSGIQVNTDGFGLGFRRGFHQTVRKKHLYEIDLTTLKHPREVKILSSDGSDGFVFAKKNKAYNIRYGLGQHNILAFKPFGEGVELKTIYSFGLITTFLKPIYYYLAEGDNQQVELKKFNEEKHNIYNIINSGPYFKGFNEVRVQPGIFGKFALSIEYAAERTSIRSLELGVVVDGYYKEVEILAFADNYPGTVSLYLSLQFGKKWYR